MNMQFTVGKHSNAVLGVVIVVILFAACTWQPESQETGALTLSARSTETVAALSLEDEAKLRVLFYEAGELDGIIVQQDDKLAYSEALPEAAMIAGDTERVFSVESSSGTLPAIIGIPADTAYTVLITRTGRHDSRLQDLEVEYAEEIEYLTHGGVSQTFEVTGGQTTSVEIGLLVTEHAAVEASLEVQFAPSLSDGAFGEVIGVPDDAGLALEVLEEFDLEVPITELNNWYEQEVRDRDDTNVLRPRLTEDGEPRAEVEIEQVGDLEYIVTLDAIIPKRRLQLIVTDYDGPRRASGGFGDTGPPFYDTPAAVVGISEPFTLRPGEQRELGLQVFDIS